MAYAFCPECKRSAPHVRLGAGFYCADCDPDGAKGKAADELHARAWEALVKAQTGKTVHAPRWHEVNTRRRLRNYR